jgi:predicted O-methyltransferase YrrM
MRNITIDEIKELAARLPSIPDTRPSLLKGTHSAMYPTSTYYRFFHELVRNYGPFDVLEIGAYLGSSTAHLAYGNSGKVVTVDIEPNAIAAVSAMGFKNVIPVLGNSTFVLDKIVEHGPFDLFFIDGNHTFNSMYGEYVTFFPHVRKGGLIFVDDIELDMETDEMRIAWDYVEGPKVSIPELHDTGFGVAVKESTMSPRSWDEVIPEVARLMEEARNKKKVKVS